MRAMVKTIVLAAAGIVGFAGMSGAKVMDLGRESGGTPYDRYMGPVKNVLRASLRNDSDWDRVSRLLAEARGFRYSYDTAYVASSPAETARTRSGDCKDKSLWLLSEMGTGNARFVIGKLRENSNIKHAWVYWQSADGSWYVLDPTHRSRPLAVADVRNGMYVPYYSYAGTGVYLHDSTRPVVPATRVAAVAEVEKEEKVESKSDSQNGWSIANLFKSGESEDKANEPVAEHNMAADEKVVKTVKPETKKVVENKTRKVVKVVKVVSVQKEVVQEKETKSEKSSFASRLSRLEGRGAI